MDNQANGHGFERIDVVLEHIAKEVEASFHAQQNAVKLLSQERYNPFATQSDFEALGMIEPRYNGLSSMLERVNARFESVAKRVRQSESPFGRN